MFTALRSKRAEVALALIYYRAWAAGLLPGESRIHMWPEPAEGVFPVDCSFANCVWVESVFRELDGCAVRGPVAGSTVADEGKVGKRQLAILP